MALLRSVLFALCALAVWPADTSSASAQEPAPILEWGQQIPMRDGVGLNATIYRPATDRPAPVVVTITPYIADRYHADAVYFTSRGFAFAIVDTRGRGNSGGVFTPFQGDGQDGHDVVEWLAQQNWSDGRVAMRGGSYGGYNQWVTAAELPPHLRAIIPAASGFPGIDVPMKGGVRFPYYIQWLTLTAGRTLNMNIFADNNFWLAKYRTLYETHAPLRTLDSLAGHPSPQLQEWLDHPDYDPYWRRQTPSAAAFARINLPILTITGAYDDDQLGAMEFYHRHFTANPAAASARHQILIGPWDHAGTRNAQASFGGATFGPASVIDIRAVEADWLHWVLDGAPRPTLLSSPVTYYVAGADEWRHAPTIGAVADGELDLRLATGAGGTNVARPGLLALNPPAGPRATNYVYDPRQLTPAGVDAAVLERPLTAQEPALAINGDGTVFETAPFENAVVLAGSPRLEAWIALDVPDTDFVVTLYEIAPNGDSLMLSQAWLRARYRTGLSEPVAAPRDRPQLYTFSNFNFCARQIRPGSRLRLTIGPPNSALVEKNYNSGGAVADETGADARRATVRIFHSRAYPSRLLLPTSQGLP